MHLFRKAAKNEAETILSLYRLATEKGRIDGTSDWDDEYPNKEILEEDLLKECLFVLEDEGDILAAITIMEEENMDIQSLNWTKAISCFLVRLCVSPGHQGKGIGEKMMHYASEYAKGKGFEATHHLAAKVNKTANNLYARMGYHIVGVILLYETDFIAYEMLL